MNWAARLIDSFARAKGAPPRTLARFMTWALQGTWGAISIALVLSFLLGALETAGALLVGWVIDTALNSEADLFFEEYFWSVIVIAIVFLIIRPILMFGSAAMGSYVIGPGVFTLILSRISHYTLGQSLQFFDDDFAGRISQKQIQTASSMAEIVVETINAMAYAIVMVLSTILILGGVSPWLALGLAIWTVCYLLLIRALLPRVRHRAKARAAARAGISGQIVDTLSNIATVKLFANAELEDDATRNAIRQFRDRGREYGVAATTFRTVLVFFAGFLPVGLISGTFWLWHMGIATAGDIALAGLLSTRIAQMTGWISFTAMAIYSHIGEVEDGIRTLTPSHGIVDRRDAISPARSGGDIVFDDVTFHYGREDDVGLSDFSLHVKPGERVGLVGGSGAGKSTATSLLLRLYDLEHGEVQLDGQNIATLTQDGLRRQIAMVRQETSMFNRAAFDNILYGRPDADAQEVYAAARQAEAHEFIENLRDLEGRQGYDAHLGERGVKLSGGQRQRIALARAILKDAPVLVLDEATSALDSEVEAAIQDTLWRVMEGKTVIAIAHRLSTIARMDRIVVMEAGRIVETGTHAELLARNGRYAGFWSRQSGGFIGIEAAE